MQHPNLSLCHTVSYTSSMVIISNSDAKRVNLHCRQYICHHNFRASLNGEKHGIKQGWVHCIQHWKYILTYCGSISQNIVDRDVIIIYWILLKLTR